MPLKIKKIDDINNLVASINALTLAREPSPELISQRKMRQLRHLALSPSLGDLGLSVRTALSNAEKHNTQVRATTPSPKTAVLFLPIDGENGAFAGFDLWR